MVEEQTSISDKMAILTHRRSRQRYAVRWFMRNGEWRIADLTGALSWVEINTIMMDPQAWDGMPGAPIAWVERHLDQFDLQPL